MNRNFTGFLKKAVTTAVGSFRNVSSETQPEKDNQFSPYLLVVKPLIDVTKRAQIHELVIQDPLFLSELAKIYKFKSEHHGSLSELELIEDKDVKSWYEDAFCFYQSKRKEQQKKLLSSMCRFRSAVVESFTSMGYQTHNLNNHQFEVSRNSSRAIIELPDANQFQYHFDHGWNKQSAKTLHESKQSLSCDAAIYLSPGKTDTSIRSYCQKLDIFTLSGWDTVQLLLETDSFEQFYTAS